MSERPPLRAVQPGETAGPTTPKSISEALDGSARDVLASMRKALAKKLDDGDIASNSIAAAYKELRELDRLIRVADAELAAEEAKRSANSDRDRRSFDASAI
jgi:hypothetical protein